MATKSHKYGLMEAFGVELEYMIVNRDTLAIFPVADQFFKHLQGSITNEVSREKTTWSNELVNHVIELKTKAPVKSLSGFSKTFQEDIETINKELAAFNACLLPTGAHPWMDPLKETKLWPNENNEIYNLYDEIFSCKGHGWSNLQSTHLNMAFGNDEGFHKLHAAIRFLMPILPALSASTPLLEGKLTGIADTRLSVYAKSQKRLPLITGNVIPERAYSEAAYKERILDPLAKIIAPFDPHGILEPDFLNSRGAIARFDRGAIELRILDIQECPKADLALLELITAVIKEIINGRWGSLEEIGFWHEIILVTIYDKVVKRGDHTWVDQPAYLAQWGCDTGSMAILDLWQHIYDAVSGSLSKETQEVVKTILRNGNLSSRIQKAVGPGPDSKKLYEVYGKLSECLASNTLFMPK